MEPHLPGDGEIFKSKNKRYKDTIVFVPFSFGKKEQLKKHAEMVNDIGFDCVLFNLSSHLVKDMPKMILNTPHGWGLKHLWAQETKAVLDAIEGPKIIYAFSNPAASAIEATAMRNATDIIAIICDGGPFYDLLKCNWNFFNFEYPMTNLFAKLAANAFARGTWSVHHEKELFEELSALPKDFPILSIRGWQDPLVPPTSIEKAFANHPQLDLEILNLPQGKHLDGLKHFPEAYKPRVEEFLKSVGNILLASEIKNVT